MINLYTIRSIFLLYRLVVPTSIVAAGVKAAAAPERGKFFGACISILIALYPVLSCFAVGLLLCDSVTALAARLTKPVAKSATYENHAMSFYNF